MPAVKKAKGEHKNDTYRSMLTLHPFVPAAPCRVQKIFWFNSFKIMYWSKKQVEMFIFCHIRSFESKIIPKRKFGYSRLNFSTKNHVFLKMFLWQSILFSPQAVRFRGGVVSKEVALAVAETLIKLFPEKELGHTDLRSSYWTQSLFRRMGFRGRAATARKFELYDVLLLLYGPWGNRTQDTTFIDHESTIIHKIFETNSSFHAK